MTDPTQGRYNKNHYYGTVEFYLGDFCPDPEQSRFLLLKVMEQAIRDDISLADSESPAEQLLWEEAEGYLFNDEYKISWGDLEVNLDDILTMIDMDISWVRKEVRRKFKEKHGNYQPRRRVVRRAICV